jgi:DNA (cytosine-5)-methyltransferase 1
MNQLKVFSFFSGSGFLDLGFKSSGFNIAFVNEYYGPFLEAYKYSRKKMKLPDPDFGYSNLCVEEFLEAPVSSARLARHVKECKAENSLIGFIGGPPCPDFSLGGKHKGFEGENGRLTRVYFDLIIKHKPDWFLFENVKGFFHTKKHREFFDQLLEDMRNAGYAISYDIINALEFGVPQYRDRVIIFGIKKTHVGADFVLPVSNTEHYVQYSELKSFSSRRYAKYKLNKVLEHKWPQRRKFRVNSIVKEPDSVPLDLTSEYWFRKNDVYNHPNAGHHFMPTKGNERFFTIEEGCTNGKSYKRLHRWRYSPTAAYGNNEVHLHPYKARRLSAAEAMAIQSMPKKYELPPDMALSSMFKTIGNGVPFLMACGIAKTIRKYLSELEVSTTKNLMRSAAK